MKTKIIVICLVFLLVGFGFGFISGINYALNMGLGIAEKLLNVELNNGAMNKLIAAYPQLMSLIK